MLLKKNPKTNEDYSCFILTLRNDVSWANQLHIQPTRTKNKSGSIYKFVISGTLYLFYIPKYHGEDFIKEFILKDTNEIKILHAPKNQGKDLLKKFLYG